MCLVALFAILRQHGAVVVNALVLVGMVLLTAFYWSGTPSNARVELAHQTARTYLSRGYLPRHRLDPRALVAAPLRLCRRAPAWGLCAGFEFDQAYLRPEQAAALARELAAPCTPHTPPSDIAALFCAREGPVPPVDRLVLTLSSSNPAGTGTRLCRARWAVDQLRQRVTKLAC